jgi:ubiquitin carboxyl-terminal hydrolase 4/11/15
LDDGIELLSDPLARSSHRFDFPDPSSNKASPASSTEAEGDPERDWEGAHYTFGNTISPNWSPMRSPATLDLHSPSENSSSMSDINPFIDDSETSAHLKID